MKLLNMKTGILLFSLAFLSVACDSETIAELQDLLGLVTEEETVSSDTETSEMIEEDFSSTTIGKEVPLTENKDGKKRGKGSLKHDKGFFKGTCAQIEVIEDSILNTKTVTIDFGSDGCTDLRTEKVIKGKIIITMNNLDGSANTTTRTTSYENHYIDDNQITGSKEVVTSTETGTKVREGSLDYIVLFADGSGTITKKGTFSSTQTEGYDTLDNKEDDVYTRSENYSSVNSADNTTFKIIATDLVKKISCFQTVSGTKQITKDDETSTLDYGDGSCDGEATLTKADGTTSTISLKERGKHSKRK